MMISVIIPVYNDPKKLRSCLEAVKCSAYPDFECIVIDDNSTDNTVRVAEEFQVKVIRLQHNGGPAHARNLGARASSGEILFFMDSDVVIFPDTISKIARAFEQHQDTDAIIGSYDDQPVETSFVSEFKNLYHHYVHQKANEVATTFWSGCGAIRRKVFLDAGGFSETFKRPAIEDIELGCRLTGSNHKILLKKEIQVKHLKRWTFWGLLKTDVFDRGIPWTHLMLRARNMPNDLNVTIPQRLCVVMVYLMLLLPFTFLFYKKILIVPVLMFFTILIINVDLYRFFIQKRDLSFAAMAVPFHLLYYYYSGLSFFLGLITYPFRKNIT